MTILPNSNYINKKGFSVGKGKVTNYIKGAEKVHILHILVPRNYFSLIFKISLLL